MEFTITREALLAGIEKVSVAITDKNSPTPAFQVMLVEAKRDDSVRFAAVGEKCSVDTVVAAQVKGHGHFHVVPSHFQELAERMPVGPIQISMTKERVRVKSGKREFKFGNRQIDIRQIEDPGPKVEWIKLNAREVLEACRYIKGAGTWIYERDRQNGIWLVRRGGKIKAFATNGQLLAHAMTDIVVPNGDPLFLPLLALDALQLMAKDGKEVRLYQDERRIFLENEETLMSAALAPNAAISGYDMYMGLIDPKSCAQGPTFKIERLRDSVKSVLAARRFAEATEKAKVHSERGEALSLKFSDKISVELVQAESEGVDEFDSEPADAPRQLLAYHVASKFLELMLASFGTLAEATAYRPDEQAEMLVLYSEGVSVAVMGMNKENAR